MREGIEEKRARDEIRSFSQELVKADLLEYYGGNLSVRVGDDQMMITRTHVNKAIPADEDIVRTSITGDDASTPSASSAWLVHQAIYQVTDARAIIHAHPSKTVALSFFMDEIVPPDENGMLYLRPKVSVVGAPSLFGWNLAANALAAALIDVKVVVEKWHGTFAKGVDLADAFHRTRGMEFMADKIINIATLRQVWGEPTPLPTTVASVAGGVERAGLRRIQ